MVEHFRDGGFGMWPTLFFGLMLLLASVQYARTPEKRFVPLMTGLGILTLSSGGLGFVTGLMTTAKAVQTVPLPEGERALISFYGFGESLNNVAFALAFLVLASMAACVGAFRVASRVESSA